MHNALAVHHLQACLCLLANQTNPILAVLPVSLPLKLAEPYDRVLSTIIPKFHVLALPEDSSTGRCRLYRVLVPTRIIVDDASN